MNVLGQRLVYYTIFSLLQQKPYLSPSEEHILKLVEIYRIQYSNGTNKT